MKFIIFFVVNSLVFAETYKVELINDPFDPNWLGAIAAILVAITSLFAGFRYFFVEGTLYKHTELFVDCKSLGEIEDKKIVEVSVRISNKGKKIMTFYNFHLVASNLKNEKLSKLDKYDILEDEKDFFDLLLEKNMITPTDEYVRLHADTSYIFNTYLAVKKDIHVLKFELWVLYIQRRVDDFAKGYDMERLENQEFNSIEKVFYLQ